ncbi:single-stranded DNA-binding protein [Plasmodium sp. gorilla clade G2]|uniref:single-stranded DNA-binding protein n=1 Tax=Plasmodium sp. gorilla clade G2 TaxID=880535 RepID=UPI000D220AFC|nr:single-stranded DNA-binding protein [Plasmodium sp. gorilla clade G2]SOV11607.1 single-stranded DNA-binding protein [Plasmodium sp. gorilla clade G2]
MLYIFLSLVIYFNYVFYSTYGYIIGDVKVHQLNNIINKRIIKSRKVSMFKISLQNDFNYENKRFYNNMNRNVMNEKSLNKIMLIGRVGGEPDIKILNGGDKVATFSLATNEFWRDRNTNELKSKTDWHRIVVYDQNIVDLIDKYLRKGRRVYVQGSLHTRKWYGNDVNNQPKQITEIILSYNKGDLIFLDDKRNFIQRNNTNNINAENQQHINNDHINNEHINNNDNNNNTNSNDFIPLTANDKIIEDKEFNDTIDDNNEEDNFQSNNDTFDKHEGIYDKMNVQEFEE